MGRIPFQFLQILLLPGNPGFSDEVEVVCLEFGRVVHVRQQQQVHSLVPGMEIYELYSLSRVVSTCWPGLWLVVHSCAANKEPTCLLTKLMTMTTTHKFPSLVTFSARMASHKSFVGTVPSYLIVEDLVLCTASRIRYMCIVQGVSSNVLSLSLFSPLSSQVTECLPPPLLPILLVSDINLVNWPTEFKIRPNIYTYIHICIILAA